MFIELYGLLGTSLNQTDLLDILKNEALLVSIYDIITATSYIRRDVAEVGDKYGDIYIEGFILRIKEVKENNCVYSGSVDPVEYRKALDLLYTQSQTVESVRKPFFRIYIIISLYTTFILDEPIHPVGSPFPGGLEVEFDGEFYTCPVKDNNNDNPLAVCPFCIAKQQ